MPSASISPGNSGLALVATTGPNGFAKQNATPQILSWTAPNDGNLHRFMIVATESVTSTETGGQITNSYSAPGGGGIITVPIFAAGSGAGPNQGNLGERQAQSIPAGSTVSIQQATALTAGGPTIVYAEIWGS